MRQVFTSFNTTSSIGAVEKLLSPTDLDPFLVSEEEGVEKPHPSIFDTAIRHAGVPATQALHIGDELNA
jgi:FMN phosphatase YigB (HAD superfamily)